ncbi:MAG: hypothetical protein ACRDP6_48900 [Actinoallomurus sp.]
MNVAGIVTDLEFVVAYWPDLTESRLPGTARPWRQPELTPDQRAELDHAARLERAERSEDAWGETPAPVDVSVLDLMADVVWDADEAAGLVADAIMCPRLAPPPTAYSDAREWLDFAARHAGEVLDGGRLNAVAWLARGMVDAIARALCLVYDGQRLAVICPWCQGRTEAAPVGGAKTWRVRQLPGDLVAIVCEGTCEPPSKSVGTWWRGQPCWPVSEWDWLAKQVTVTEERERINA